MTLMATVYRHFGLATMPWGKVQATADLQRMRLAVEAALAAFTSLYPSPLSAADLAALTTHPEHTGLSRTAVVDLASELPGELPQQGDRV